MQNAALALACGIGSDHERAKRVHSLYYYIIILPLQVTIPECGVAVEERFGHSVTAISRNPSLIEVTIFGGSLDFDFVITKAEHLLLPGTMVLKFGMLAIQN